MDKLLPPTIKFPLAPACSASPSGKGPPYSFIRVKSTLTRRHRVNCAPSRQAVSAFSGGPDGACPCHWDMSNQPAIPSLAR